MGNTEFIGSLVLVAIPVVISFIALIKPIINLNINIQKLSDTLAHLKDDNTALKGVVDEHEEKLNNHETRISIIESRNK